MGLTTVGGPSHHIQELRSQVADLQSQLRMVKAITPHASPFHTHPLPPPTPSTPPLLSPAPTLSTTLRPPTPSTPPPLSHARTLSTTLRQRTLSIHRATHHILRLSHHLKTTKTLLDLVWGDEGDVNELAPLRELTMEMAGSLEVRLEDAR